LLISVTFCYHCTDETDWIKRCTIISSKNPFRSTVRQSGLDKDGLKYPFVHLILCICSYVVLRTYVHPQKVSLISVKLGT